MSVFRIYPSKSNTIASGPDFEDYNSSQNPVSDLWYGGGFEESGVFRPNSVSRLLLYFDLSGYISKLQDETINEDLVTSYRLVLKNAVPSDRILTPDYSNATIYKQIASSFDLIAFPIDMPWDEGRGYDLYESNYIAKGAGYPHVTGFSNWNFAKYDEPWDEPGIYTNPTASTPYWSSQHFPLGGEDINMDITDIVKDWLSGGSENNGIAIAYSDKFENFSGNNRYISSFFTQKTNSAFKPYIQVNYDQVIRDDRTTVTNNRKCRLFLYAFSGNQAANYFSAGTVSIKTMNNVDVITGLVPKRLQKGVYYVDVTMSSALPGQRYKDVWNGVTFHPGLDKTDFVQFFDINQNYYTSGARNVNDYVVTTYGMNNNEVLQTDELIRIYAETRVNFSLKNPKTDFGLEYRMTMNNTIELVPWTPCNSAVIDSCYKCFFDLDTSWLLTNQNYQITFRISEFGTKRIIAERLNFKVVDKMFPLDY